MQLTVYKPDKLFGCEVDNTLSSLNMKNSIVKTLLYMTRYPLNTINLINNRIIIENTSATSNKTALLT